MKLFQFSYMDTDAVAIILGILGLANPWHEIFSGLLFALIGSYLAKRVIDSSKSVRHQTLTWGSTIISSIFTAFLTAITFAQFDFHIALQLSMGLAGFFSSIAIPLLLKIASRLSYRASDIADRFLDKALPHKDE